MEIDLSRRLGQLADRIKQQKKNVNTEEATKTAFILPFIQELGYDIFNPEEVIPELVADHGTKKGEKIDYAIKINGEFVILIECKKVDDSLKYKQKNSSPEIKQADASPEYNHASQLFRYFSVTNSRFGVLTNGIKYVFFSDLVTKNTMDTHPFFEFNLLQFNDEDVDKLKKFTKASFNIDAMISTARNLKCIKDLTAEIKKALDNPSDEIVRVFTSKVYTGKITQQVHKEFTEFTKIALNEYLKEKIKEKLNNAAESSEMINDSSKVSPENASADDVSASEIITTQEEIDGYRIIQTIGAEIVSVERIVLRDAKSYCAILFDDNNRKPICRFYFNRKKPFIGVFSKEGEKKHEISKVSDIYKFKLEIMDCIKQYSEENGVG